MERLGRVRAHIANVPQRSSAAGAGSDWCWGGSGGSEQQFELRGRAAFLIAPTRPSLGPTPWVWYAPTLLPGLPDTKANGAEVFMFERFLKAGIAVAGIDVGESYGSPAGQQLFTALYDELAQQGFSNRPVLLGRSRGGLQSLAWAIANPDRVGGWAGIYPVCNILSYPGVEKACAAFGLTEDELQREIDAYNPLSKIGAAAVRTCPPRAAAVSVQSPRCVRGCCVTACYSCNPCRGSRSLRSTATSIRWCRLRRTPRRSAPMWKQPAAVWSCSLRRGRGTTCGRDFSSAKSWCGL
jgi:pimeloyl-ACP methyl ester carboxylesterase